jgi:hypothetical protein
VTADAIGSVVLALVVGVVGIVVGRIYESDAADRRMDLSERQLRAGFHTTIDRMKEGRAKEREYGQELTGALDEAREEVAVKQRRVRGLLTEARRWKAIAASLGWKRETRESERSE